MSLSAECPQPQVNTRSASVRSPWWRRRAEQSLLDGYQRSAIDELAAAPGLLVAQQAGELGPAGIGDGSGQPVVGQHPGHVEVLDDEPVVGLDQLVGHLVQEMAAHIGDVMVVTAQPGGGVRRLCDPFFLRDNDFASRRWLFHPGGERFGRIGDAGDLGAVGGGGDQERRQAAIHTDPAAGSSPLAGRVLVGGVQVGGLDVQRHPPAPAVVA